MAEDLRGSSRDFKDKTDSTIRIDSHFNAQDRRDEEELRGL